MKIQRSIQAAVASVALVSPLAVFAQTVTTSPLAVGAPALSLPMLVVAAMLLIGLGAYSIRTGSGRAMVGFALVVGVSLVTGLIYANGGVFIEGAECNKETVSPYPSWLPNEPLTSLCPNRIKIVAIDPDCGMQPGVSITADTVCVVAQNLAQLCSVGQILGNGDTCTLPSCGPPCE